MVRPNKSLTRLLPLFSEREVPPADRARDPEAEGTGRGAQPGAEGVERETATQEEGAVCGAQTKTDPETLECKVTDTWGLGEAQFAPPLSR